ncbi:hypothetical protein N7454_004001 [Penicillium verhagenii]|nr:hypothetical protein N7454_004001 [Penicillium verhagenii]
MNRGHTGCRGGAAKQRFIEDVLLIRQNFLTPGFIREAFKDCGIHPLDRDVTFKSYQEKSMNSDNDGGYDEEDEDEELIPKSPNTSPPI